jgi:hypothetical protein
MEADEMFRKKNAKRRLKAQCLSYTGSPAKYHPHLLGYVYTSSGSSCWSQEVVIPIDDDAESKRKTMLKAKNDAATKRDQENTEAPI